MPIYKEPCGCEREIRPMESFSKSDFLIRGVFIDNRLCAYHKEEKSRLESERAQKSKKRAQELSCSSCGVPLGYVDEFDLNSSVFYCSSCKFS